MVGATLGSRREGAGRAVEPVDREHGFPKMVRADQDIESVASAAEPHPPLLSSSEVDRAAGNFRFRVPGRQVASR